MTESQFELRLKTILAGYSLPGLLTTVGVNTVRVYLKNYAGKILVVEGNTVPANGTATYAKGCLFFKDDSVYGNSGVYENVGTITSCLFRLVGGMRLAEYLNPAAKAVAVHAAVQEGAANAFPGAFTSPAIPRSLQVVFAAGWQGGDITIIGTDQFDNVISEVIADVAGTTVEGVKIFKTVVSASKETIAGTTDTATLQTGPKIGIPFWVANAFGILTCNGVAEAVVVDATYSGFTPATSPDGSRDYVLCAQ